MSEFDPMSTAQAAMRAGRPKRFYRHAEAGIRDGAWVVLLDGRLVRTPSRRPLALPSAALAKEVVAEWAGQGDHIAPETMPLTRFANSAIDGVADHAEAVRDDVVRFVDSDLVCYRAQSPAGLVEAQARHWDPMVAWALETLSIRLILAEGVMHVDQPAESIVRAREVLESLEIFPLAAVHAMTTLTGSAVLSLAVAHGRLDPDAAWTAAHVDEDWQIGRWGADAEAMARRDARWRDMNAAGTMVQLASA